jgi:polysaccharide biosynthesis protein PslL
MKMPRIEWIDILKGLGIILVVAGHIFPGLPSEIIFTFHMPLFFLLGGWLYRPVQDYRAFLRNKAIHLLIPYAAFLTIIYSEVIFQACRYAFSHRTLAGVKGVLVAIFNGIYGGEILRGPTSAFWFVICFFATQQIFNYLFHRLDQRKLPFVLLLSLVISYLDSYFLRHLSFPSCLNVVFAALPYFGLGFYLKNLDLKKWMYAACSGIWMVGLALITQGYPIAYDMKYAQYGIPGLTGLLAVCAIVLLIGLSKLLVKLPWVKQPLTYVGNASMVILYVHQWVQVKVQSYAGVDAIWLRFGAALSVSLLVYQIVTQSVLMRALFLGSVKDFRAIFVPLKNSSAQ